VSTGPPELLLLEAEPPYPPAPELLLLLVVPYPPAPLLLLVLPVLLELVVLLLVAAWVLDVLLPPLPSPWMMVHPAAAPRPQTRVKTAMSRQFERVSM
jgi:hypothetical protein